MEEFTEAETTAIYGEVKSKDEIIPRSLSLDIVYHDLTYQNEGALKKMLETCLPVKYQKTFYEKLINLERYSKLAYYKDVLIGAITCKEDVDRDEETGKEEKGVYIMTITVLEPYRRYGLASKMLTDAMEDYKKFPDLESIFLDVQVNNKSAMEFYAAQGFENVKMRKDYYTHIEPADSYFLRKSLKE